jgi:hypothetical protein
MVNYFDRMREGAGNFKEDYFGIGRIMENTAL